MPTRFVRNSETSIWRQCKLKWLLSYFLGYLNDSINKHFWLGGLVHLALSEWYLGKITDPAHFFWWLGSTSIAQERGFEISIDGERFETGYLNELEKYLVLGQAMLEGYVEWAKKENCDFDVIDSELAYFLEQDGFTFVARFDLLTENSEGIRVDDFKTASDFRAEKTVDQDQQFRRYPWLVSEVHPEWANSVAGSKWVALRKMAPSARSKPPYFKRQTIDLSPTELHQVGLELFAEVTDMLFVEERLNEGVDPRCHIYPSPSVDCSWKCNFFGNGICRTWRAGASVDAIKQFGELFGSWENDHYAEYRADFEGALPIGIASRREGLE